MYLVLSNNHLPVHSEEKKTEKDNRQSFLIIILIPLCLFLMNHTSPNDRFAMRIEFKIEIYSNPIE